MDRSHWVGVVVSGLLLITAVVAISFGTYAWRLDRNPPTEVGRSPSAVSPGETPPFDPGVTLFAREVDLDTAKPERWGCTLTSPEGRRALVTRGDMDRSGTRVHKGVALVPALVVGRTSAEATLACTDLPSEVTVWSLPTDAGYPRVPMALVIGGVALAGVSALVHPRARGLGRFA